MIDQLYLPRFYQILGYQGHFKKDYWRWFPGADEPSDFHEWAHEKPAAKAIAGPESVLYADAPTDEAETSAVRSVELILGIRPWGAISVLLDRITFETYVIPQAGIDRPTKKLPPLYSTSDFLSLSPIKFTSMDELEDFFKAIRPKKAATYGGDDSKLNKGLSIQHPNRGRAEFEQARLLQYGFWRGRHPVFDTYGLPPLSPHLRIAYLAFTPWIDPNSYNIRPNEDDPTLDIGWYDAKTGTVHHIIVEEYETMSKTTLPKAAFKYGESTTRAESSLSGTFTHLLTPPPETPTGPLVLVVYDWPRTARLLNSHGVDTTGPNWHVGLSQLLGFERLNQIKQPRHKRMRGENGNGDRGPWAGNGNGDEGENGAERRRDNGWQDRTRRPSAGYRNLDDPDYDAKPKIEPKEETKAYGGRWDSSSPIRKRSQSPRSRSRPLSDLTDRKYQRPVFNPDDEDENKDKDKDKEPGECSSPQRPASPATTPTPSLPEIHVIDIRSLFSVVLNAPEPREYTTYPPCARRLGFPVDGWCAGNQAVQMHTILDSLVGGEPIHRREAEVKAKPGLPAPTPPPGSDNPVLLEGIAGGPTVDNVQAAQQSFINEWNNTHDSDDEDGW
ncbi:hypothetical protein FRC12_000330 [Ceratobasidium sp. 428]|nr:hypothetical protein FRC12_000330 [Ceratobasidium sp. 428]